MNEKMKAAHMSALMILFPPIPRIMSVLLSGFSPAFSAGVVFDQKKVQQFLLRSRIAREFPHLCTLRPKKKIPLHYFEGNCLSKADSYRLINSNLHN
jgi:hypothetical protein